MVTSSLWVRTKGQSWHLWKLHPSAGTMEVGLAENPVAGIKAAGDPFFWSWTPVKLQLNSDPADPNLPPFQSFATSLKKDAVCKRALGFRGRMSQWLLAFLCSCQSLRNLSPLKRVLSEPFSFKSCQVSERCIGGRDLRKKEALTTNQVLVKRRIEQMPSLTGLFSSGAILPWHGANLLYQSVKGWREGGERNPLGGPLAWEQQKASCLGEAGHSLAMGFLVFHVAFC